MGSVAGSNYLFYALFMVEIGCSAWFETVSRISDPAAYDWDWISNDVQLTRLEDIDEFVGPVSIAVNLFAIF